MKLYLDTSAYVKLYYPEPETSVLSIWLRLQQYKLLFNSFNELEMTNAFSQKLFRKEITPQMFMAWNRQLQQDKAKGILSVINLDWTDVFARSIQLSFDYSSKLNTSSLDVVHVAAALQIGAELFVTNDRRQLALAREIGMNSKDVGELK
ncbi:MAG: type II toxin-antitoxin system VapC family toxin [Spirochaetia bacterium]